MQVSSELATQPMKNPKIPITNSIEKPLAFQKFKIIASLLYCRSYIKTMLLILSHPSQYWLHFVHFHSLDSHFFLILATEYPTLQFLYTIFFEFSLVIACFVFYPLHAGCLFCLRTWLGSKTSFFLFLSNFFRVTYCENGEKIFQLFEWQFIYRRVVKKRKVIQNLKVMPKHLRNTTMFTITAELQYTS